MPQFGRTSSGGAATVPWGRLKRLADEDGPLDSAEDEAEIARYMSLLNGFDEDAR